jgi:hypothetical protein
MAWPVRSGWLVAAATASFALVVLHLGIILVGAPAYEYFVAGDTLVRLAEQGSFVPTLVTGLIAGAFLLFGLYALAAAGFFDLPAHGVLTIAIGCLYVLRGSLIVPEALLVQYMGRPPRTLVFAAVSLAIGLVYLIGMGRRWPHLDAHEPTLPRTAD